MTLPSPSVAASPPVAGPPADAGLLVIHGVGSHAAGRALDDIVEPFLARIAEEGQLLDVLASPVGPETQPGGPHQALVARYDAGAGERRLLIVEGRWDGSYLKAGPATVSGWLIRSSPKMLWELLRYHARGWLWPFSLVALGLFGTGIAFSRDDCWWLPLALILGSFAVAGAVVHFSDAAEFANAPMRFFDRVRFLPALVATLIAYQFQRGLVLLVAAAGIVVAPLALVVLRLAASVPLLSGVVAKGLLPGVERALLTGGIADMQAVVGDEVTAAAIRSRLRSALVEVESRLAPGATLTVVAHSGGAPVAWNLLTEIEAADRPASATLRYRLITVGAALNWTHRGFEGRAMPLDRPLLHFDRPPEEQTRWMNVYSTWDPVPHGPAPHREFGYAARWDEPENAESPNRLVRNLGGPVPDEHGEYWSNQQEFVPIVARAVDEGFAWAVRDAGPDMRRWAHCRLALIATLVRVRLTVLTLPFAAAAAIPLGTRFFGASDYDNRLTRALKDGARGALKGLLGDDGAERVILQVYRSPALASAVAVVLLFLLALAALDVYTNVCWFRLGRRAASLRPASQDWWRAVEPVGAALVWLPALALPLLLFPFEFSRATHITLAAVNTTLCLLDCMWLNGSLLALARKPGFDFLATAIGRERAATLRATPAGASAAALDGTEHETKRSLTIIGRWASGR